MHLASRSVVLKRVYSRGDIFSVSRISVRHSAPVRFGNLSRAGYLNTRRQAKCCSKAALEHVQASDARHCTLNTAPCVVFWDTDNINARKQDDIELTCRKLQAHTACAVTKLKGESMSAPDVYIVAYSNQKTSSSSKDHIAILREMPDVLVRPVSSWRGSADQAIITDMTALAAERGAAVAVALVSCDRGFATALRFCRGHGCPTVWISAVNTKRGSQMLGPLKGDLIMERALVSWRRKLPQTSADVVLCWEQIMRGPLDISQHTRQQHSVMRH